MLKNENITCYKRLNIDFKNEEAPDRIEFIRPDHCVDVVYPFMYQPINILYDEHGYETVSENGNAYPCFRYTPDICGEFKAVAYNANQKIDETTFNVLPSDNHGYVSVSKKDNKYFAYTDKTPFFSIGINLAMCRPIQLTDHTEFGLSENFAYLGLRKYELWFKRCSEYGVNTVRIWLGQNYLNPDTENTYEFDLKKFSLLDKLIDLAEQYNIKLKLTIEHFRHFEYDNTKTNIFSKQLWDNGKKCESIGEWLTDERWAKAWLKKADELARRYSGDTNIFAIELWNEMNCLSGDIISWNRKYIPKIKSLFPKNMVVNSFGSMDCDWMVDYYKRFCWDESDIVQIHRYIDQGAEKKICTTPIDMIKDAINILPDYNKPVIIAETGAVNDCHSGPFRFYSSDDRGIIFADTVYTPIFCKSGGCGNIWHWDAAYVESKNLYKMFNPICTLMRDIDFANEGFESRDHSDENAYIYTLHGKNAILCYIRNREDSWQNVLRDCNVPNTISSISIKADNIKNAEIITIWNEESATVEITDSGVIINELKYGMMLKLTR